MKFTFTAVDLPQATYAPISLCPALPKSGHVIWYYSVSRDILTKSDSYSFISVEALSDITASVIKIFCTLLHSVLNISIAASLALLVFCLAMASSYNSQDRPREPRVSIPPPPTIPTETHPHPALQPLPHEPSIRTLPEYGPNPSFARPGVNLPQLGYSRNLPSNINHASYHQNLPTSGPIPFGLEDPLRGMILHNSSGPVSHIPQSPSRCQIPESNLSQANFHTHHRRPNQAQRRHQARSLQQAPSQAFSREAPRSDASQQVQVVRPFPHSDEAGPSAALPYAQQALDRRESFKANPRLYDPSQSNLSPVLPRTNVGSRQPPRFNLQDQIHYLDRLACSEIPRIEMTPEEYTEKETLRKTIEALCRKAIVEFEQVANPDFDPSSVELKSFGSLNNGFATKDSDMDVVLLSPLSKPELSSPESEVPRLVEKTLMDAKYGSRLLTQTRVPIVKFCERPDAKLAGCLRWTRLAWEFDRDHPPQQSSQKPTESVVVEVQAMYQPTCKSVSVEALDETNLVIPAQSPRILSIARTSANLTDEKGSPVPKTTDQKPATETKTSLESASRSAYGIISVRNDQGSYQTCPSRYTSRELEGLFQHLLHRESCKPDKSLVENLIGAYGPVKRPHEISDPEQARRFFENHSNFLQQTAPPSREDLEYPKWGTGIQCDINFSNQLALHNSQLLKCYSLCDPRVRIIVLFVKAWTKKRKINSPYHGTMNSYGYVLMVLHYLINVAKPPVLPNLQLMSDEIGADFASASTVMFKGHNVQFFRNETKIKEWAELHKPFANRESVGSLLRGFFEYYAQPPTRGFRWKDDVLSLRIRGGVFTKQSKGWVGARSETIQLNGPGPSTKKINHHYVVAIEDPFEIDHNVARTVFFNGIVAIKDEFRRAVSLITFAGLDPRKGPQDLFEEAADREHLQKRHGPPVKAKQAPKATVITEKSAPGPVENAEQANWNVRSRNEAAVGARRDHVNDWTGQDPLHDRREFEDCASS